MQPVESFVSMKETIVAAVDPWSTGNKLGRKSRPFVNQLIGGLHLGNDEMFAQTLGIPCRNPHKEPIDTSNPHKFEVIISLCTYTRMGKAMSDLQQIPVKTVETSFKERNIVWLQLGCSLPDDKDSWSDLVFNATYPDSPTARIDLNMPRKSTDPEHIKFRELKKVAVEQASPKEWFEPTFKVLDEALFSGKKTLVHCHAGVSRSATLVIAYLIRTYQVSFDQALSFARTKRNCVNPKCVTDLKEYENRLKQLL